MRYLILITILLLIPLSVVYAQDETPEPDISTTGLIAYTICNEELDAPCPNGIAVFDPVSGEVRTLQGAQTIDDLSPLLWSPDYQHLLYWDRGDDYGVYMHDVETQARVNMYSIYEPNSDIVPYYSWSPDGTQIAMGINNGVFTVDVATTDITWLGDIQVSRRPMWSPDGSRFLFVSSPDTQVTSRIYSIDADGGNLRVLTQAYRIAIWSNVQWSPDGSQIAFMSETEEGQGREIMIMSAEGENPISISAPIDNYGLYPVFDWAVDDTHILLRTVDNETATNTIRLVDVDTTTYVDIVATSNENFLFYALSPDRQQIAYGKRTETGTPLCTLDLITLEETCWEVDPVPYLTSPLTIAWGF